MKNLLAYFIFCILGVVVLTGIAIIIRNEFTMAARHRLLKRKLRSNAPVDPIHTIPKKLKIKRFQS